MAYTTWARMQSISSIQQHQIVFNKHANQAALATALAVILLLGALIVIVSGCYTLALKGVNAMHDVILPAVLPGALAIIASLPLLVYAYRQNEIAAPAREKFMEGVYAQLEMHKDDDKKALVTFIEEDLLTKDYRTDHNYVRKFASDIMEKTKAKRGEPLADALEEVQKRIRASYRNKKKKSDKPKP